MFLHGRITLQYCVTFMKSTDIKRARVRSVDILFVLNEITSSRKCLERARASFKGTYVWLQIFKNVFPNGTLSIAISASCHSYLHSRFRFMRTVSPQISHSKEDSFPSGVGGGGNLKPETPAPLPEPRALVCANIDIGEAMFCSSASNTSYPWSESFMLETTDPVRDPRRLPDQMLREDAEPARWNS